MDTGRFLIKQISIFSENRPGRLAAIAKALEEENINMIAVKMRDKPGGLYEIAKMLGDGQINIEYSYAYSGKEGAVLILRVDNADQAVRLISQQGATLLESKVFQ